MIEFIVADYPPFLNGPYKFCGELRVDVGAVQATFQELSDRGIRLVSHQNDRNLPPSFLRQYGTRQVFVVIDWLPKIFLSFNDFFVEVTSQKDADDLQMALSRITGTRISVETLTSWHNAPLLEGFRHFNIHP